MRISHVSAIIVIGGCLGGCAGPVKVKIETVEPKPIAVGGVKAADGDADGVPDDGTDQCLGEKEDRLPPVPDDGCPSTDKDGDGVLGADDKCPNDPETVNQYQDDDGCPDETPIAYLAGNRFALKQPIEFTPLHKVKAESKSLLSAVAAVLKTQPEIQKLEVAAYYVGSESTLRGMVATAHAKAVVDELVGFGVERERLVAKGYGNRCEGAPAESKPNSYKTNIILWVASQDGKRTSPGPCAQTP